MIQLIVCHESYLESWLSICDTPIMISRILS